MIDCSIFVKLDYSRGKVSWKVGDTCQSLFEDSLWAECAKVIDTTSLIEGCEIDYCQAKGSIFCFSYTTIIVVPETSSDLNNWVLIWTHHCISKGALVKSAQVWSMTSISSLLQLAKSTCQKMKLYVHGRPFSKLTDAKEKLSGMAVPTLVQERFYLESNFISFVLFSES